MIFGCEVFAYPMASIEWRKDGLDTQLPGDDPHISVQVEAGSMGGGHTPKNLEHLQMTLLTAHLSPV